MILLVEYRSDTVELTHAEAVELAALTKGGPLGSRQARVIERLTPAAPGRYEIQPGPYAGRLRLGSGRVLDVAARFPFHDLAVLLGLSRRVTMLHDAAAPAGAAGHGMVDLIAMAFVREAEKLAGQGLAKAYERRTFLRPPYPGTPSVTEHLRAHAGRPDRLATRASRLTNDVPVNRMLAAAHRRLAALPYAVDGLTTRLRSLTPVFQGLTASGAPPGPAEVPARYREAVELARLVLAGSTVLPTGAGTTGVSVLFNMTQLWEQYVGRWVREQHAGQRVLGQYGISLTDEGPVTRTGRADFVVSEGTTPITVYDAKYRDWRLAPDTSEIFQMHTYAHRLGVVRAVLVYPSAESRSSETRVGDVTIECRGLPLAP